MSQRELRNSDVNEAVLKRNADTVYKIAYIRTNNKYDAEDIMQDVFLRFVKKQPAFDNTEHEKAWFIRTTINRTNSFFTSAWRRNTVPLDESLPFSEKSKEDSILEIVLSLPKDISTAIHLYYYENMSVRDISSAMSKSESAVKSLLFRGRKLLKSILSADFNEKG